MTKTILLAEDSPDDALIFKQKLRQSGVASLLHLVTNGRHVIDYLEGTGLYDDRTVFPFPDVLVLDLAMPGMDGWQILQWLHNRPRTLEKILVVILTGAYQLDRLQEAYHLGAKSFLTKPLEVHEIKSLTVHWPGAWEMETPALVENRA